MTIASVGVSSVEGWKSENNLLWVANGLLLAYLLLAPRWRWGAYLFTGFLALSIRCVFARQRWSEFLLYDLLDIVEVAAGALLLRPRSILLPRFTDRAYLIRFVGFGVLGGPALAGGIYLLTSHFWGIAAPQNPFPRWMAADSLGIAIATPAFAAVFRTRFRNVVNWRRDWVYPALLLGVALAAFAQTSVPLVYLIYPLLVLLLVRLGLGYASLFTLLVAGIAGWLTIRGSGPFAAAGAANHALPSLHLQAAVAAAVFLIYSVSVVLESRRSTEQRLRKIAALHNMVTENSRDVIILADFSGHRTYVSAATLTMGGWKPEELMKQGSFELVHPEDIPKAEAAVRGLQSGNGDATFECRVRNREGGYFWVETSLRLVRHPETGAPSGILNVVREISERKHAEQKLQEAYNAVEALAITDALTGLANRRRFDQYLAIEWRRSMRDRQPLSLLMLDVDRFKAYNDTYGHQRGDSCLKQIAEACMDVVSRPGDLVARFGGEEFVVVLPNTEDEGAVHVAEEICEALRSRRLAHSGNLPGIVTISAGCATLIPRFGKHTPDLIEMADQALYRAKFSGRNRVCNGNGIEDSEEAEQTFALAEAAIGKRA
jgi:diguanylate cyclase (GGDEF)-like protein/PAS domain S-box-containing protein